MVEHKPDRSWFMALVLALAYVLAFVDRQILNLVLEFIKADFAISDTEASFLVGFAFALLFVTIGLPLGWLADRVNRRNMIALSVVAWTVMTAACGFAGSYSALFIARMGVGIGEAGLAPAAVSMIGDGYPPRQRGRALGFYTAAIPLGSGLAMLGGGALMAVAPAIAQALAPVTGLLRPWQVVFILVALPGLIVAPLVMTLREPGRGASEDGGEAAAGGALAYFRARWRLYLPLMAGFSVLPIMGFGFSAWVPSLFMRVHHWSVTEVGVGYGILLLICGPLGTLLGGGLVDRLIQRGRRDAHVGLMLLILPALGVVHALAAVMPSGGLTLALLVPGIILGAAPSAISHAALVAITPAPFRARLFAAYALTQNVLGLTLGPTLIALLTDYVFVDPLQLGQAMAIVALSAGAAGLILMAAARRGFRTALAAT